LIFAMSLNVEVATQMYLRKRSQYMPQLKDSSVFGTCPSNWQSIMRFVTYSTGVADLMPVGQTLMHRHAEDEPQ